MVDTSASANATFNNYGVSAGPFPWSDLGFTASSSVMGGVLNVATGGSTSYSLNTPVTGGETFTPGSTTLQLGYNPGWTGSLTSGPAATGDLNSKFVYNIGPINGSATLFNAPLSAPAINADLSGSLNSGFGIPVLTSQSANGLGISSGITLSAQAFCPFCVTVASVSLGFSVSTRIDQTVTATPFVTDGDLVWYTKTAPSYSSSDTFTTVNGGGGDVNNTFADPGLSLASGSATPGGYGDTNPGALFPGDTGSNPVCDPAGGECINQVTLQESPEPDDLIFPGTGLLLIACGLRRRFGYFRN